MMSCAWARLGWGAAGGLEVSGGGWVMAGMVRWRRRLVRCYAVLSYATELLRTLSTAYLHHGSRKAVPYNVLDVRGSGRNTYSKLCLTSVCIKLKGFVLNVIK